MSFSLLSTNCTTLEVAWYTDLVKLPKLYSRGVHALKHVMYAAYEVQGNFSGEYEYE